MHSIESLRNFELKIKDLYNAGKIKAPVHLRGGNEAFLIDLFQNIRPQDWVFGYWALHLECLLKGVPEEELTQEILNGHSIALKFPKYRVYGSGIVASLPGIATGLAWTIKQNELNETVYLFTGDMGAECGIFHEAVKYATFHNLPIKFVVQDNNLSVVTNTKQVWQNGGFKWWHNTAFQHYIILYRYDNIYPHSGTGQRIKF